MIKKLYVKGGYNNGICGCDEAIYQSFKDGTTKDDIDTFFQDGLHDWADSYEYLVLGWDNYPETEKDQEAIDQYYENCNWWWDFITEEEFNKGMEGY